MPDDDFQPEDEKEPQPEDFLPAASKPKGYLQRIPSLQSLNPALALFLLFLLMSLIYWHDDFGQNFWVSYQSVFVDKQYWRIASSLFIHADAMHLLDNSLLFIIFGWLLNYFYGFWVFPMVSLLAGVLTTFLSLHFHEPQIRLLGASGMIYAMVAIWIVLYVCYDMNYSIHLRLLRAVGFSLAMLFPTSFHVEIDYIAHAIGFGVGLVFGFLLIPFTRKRVRAFYGKL